MKSLAASFLRTLRSKELARDDTPVLRETPRGKVLEVSPHLFASTDIGAARQNNEDAFHISSDGALWIVADGMGGQAAGETATALTLESVTDEMISQCIDLEPECQLLKALHLAHERVREYAAQHEECAGMGCAVAAAFLKAENLHICHAGDVRCYLFRGGRIEAVTEDHSVVGALVRARLLTEDQAHCHPDRGRLEQAVGMSKPFAPAMTHWTLMSDDRVLICSDGLWDMLSKEEITEVVCSDGTMRQLATVLVDRANAAGGYDNITAILYRNP